MSKSTHTQCTLRRKQVEQIVWIPTKYAVEGQILKLKKNGRDWDDGWKVVSVGGTEDSDEVVESSRDYIRSFPSLEKNK